MLYLGKYKPAMQTLIDYFSTISSSHRAFILAGGITFFWLIESAFPLFRFNYSKWKHAGVNFFFTGTTIVVNFSMALLLVKTADWTQHNEFGLLPFLSSWPMWLQALVGVALLDFIGAWLAHYVQHRIPFLWRFHLIHHTDQQVDTTTANRHHPGESVVRFVFTTLGVALIGTPMWMVFLYQSLSVVFSQFNHANFPLPKTWDRLLSWIIVSPDMHKIHHHYQLPYTDSNYGNIFSIWDRILRTFTCKERESIVYGIDTYMQKEEVENLKNLLRIPLNSKRKPTL